LAPPLTGPFFIGEQLEDDLKDLEKRRRFQIDRYSPPTEFEGLLSEVEQEVIAAAMIAL